MGGFTLIECIIALAIAGMVMAALFDGGLTGLRAVDDAARTLEAVSLARSRLAALSVGPVPAPGVTTGEDGSGYSWRQQIARAGAGINGLVLIELRVEIAWRRDGRAHAVTLVSRRLAEAAR